MAVLETVEAVLKGQGSLQDVEQVVQNSGRPPQLDALMAAIKARSLPMVELLLERKADVNSQDSKGVSPLHMAAFEGRPNLVRLLLKTGADPNLRDRHGQSPIFFAPTRQVCEMLIFTKADLAVINAKKQTPLHFVAHAGLHDVAGSFLETFQPSALDAPDVAGHSPLLYASKSKVKTIHSFLKAFADGAEATAEAPAPAEVKEEAFDEQTSLRIPPVHVESALELKPDKEVLATPQTKCPSGHDLVPFETPEDDFLCSVCECEFPMSTILYGCRSCDYDLCRECLAHTVFHQSGRDFVAAFPELQEMSTFGESGKSLLVGTEEDLQPKTESEPDSFASQQFFAEEALGSITEENGCLFWQVLLKKETATDKYGFAQANGRLEFEMRQGKAKQILEGPHMLVVKRVYSTGLLAKWNERVPQLEVKPQDRIIAVNDENTAEGMAKEIHQPRIFLQMMRFPERFIVALSKENGVKLGFRFERPQGNFAEEVRITEVMEEGAMMAYNKTQVNLGRYAFVVLADMRIDRVNDVWGDAELIAAELKSATNVELYIRRAEHAGSPTA